MPTYIAILTLLEYFTNNFGAKSYKRDRRAKTPPAHHGDHLFETCSSFFVFFFLRQRHLVVVHELMHIS
jgi:hypothetical protein